MQQRVVIGQQGLAAATMPARFRYIEPDQAASGLDVAPTIGEPLSVGKCWGDDDWNRLQFAAEIPTVEFRPPAHGADTEFAPCVLGEPFYVVESELGHSDFPLCSVTLRVTCVPHRRNPGGCIYQWRKWHFDPYPGYTRACVRVPLKRRHLPHPPLVCGIQSLEHLQPDVKPNAARALLPLEAVHL
jgi:hypothetical protein